MTTKWLCMYVHYATVHAYIIWRQTCNLLELLELSFGIRI